MNVYFKEELVKALKVDAEKIGKQAKEGNKEAIEVISSYDFWYKCPGDSMAYILCKEAYRKWKDKENENS